MFYSCCQIPKATPSKKTQFCQKLKKMEINECQKIEVVFSEAILEYILEYE